VGDYSGQKKEIKPVTIATYQILTLTRNASDSPKDSDAEPEFRHFSLFGEKPWGLIVFDEVHQLPAHLFQAAASVQSRRRLGLTATLIREDGMEGDVFALVGPKLYDAPWRDLERAGWIAPALCIEIRVPVPDALLLEYATASKREQPTVAAANPVKNAWVKALLARHPDVPTLIIGTYLEGLKVLSRELGIPMLDGSASQTKRDALFDAFRCGKNRVLIVSRIANTSIDLPDATVAIQISGQFGSRQEEAQRLGRVLRPKEDGRQAFFYTLVSQDTVEQDFALKRQIFLCEQGYAYDLHIAQGTLPDIPSIP
jgi:DNA excision repair protein ERCC-3